MATTPLEQLDEHGQSVWIDFLSRDFVEKGDLQGLIDQGVRGVTSNPTIFQSAIADGDAYDEQLREVLKETTEPKEVFLQLATRDIQGACDLFKQVHDDGDGKDGWVSLEVDPNLAHDTAGHDRGGQAPARAGRPQEPAREDPRHEGGPAGDRGVDRERDPDQRHADLLARPPPRGRRGLRPRARAPRRGRRGPGQRRLGRLLLRLARRHRGRQAPRRARRPRRAQGQARDRERQARLPDLQGGLLGRPLAGARRQGRLGAASACGRRPRPRTTPTRTRSTSRSSSGPRPSTRCRASSSRRCSTTATSAATRSRRTSTAPARCSRT